MNTKSFAFCTSLKRGGPFGGPPQSHSCLCSILKSVRHDLSLVPFLHNDSKGGKSSILDIRAHTKDGEIINIEIQRFQEKGFRKRLAYLNSRIFSGQLHISEEYWILNRTITVVITDFVLLKENKDCANRFQWYNKDNGTLLTYVQEIERKRNEYMEGVKLNELE